MVESAPKFPGICAMSILVGMSFSPRDAKEGGTSCTYQKNLLFAIFVFKGGEAILFKNEQGVKLHFKEHKSFKQSLNLYYNAVGSVY